MFSRQHRKARVLFGLSDVVLIALAFQAAYLTRSHMDLEREFYILGQTKALLLGFVLVVWINLGVWARVYEDLNTAAAKLIFRHTVRQCAYTAVALIIFEYALRLDLSRPFLGFFLGYSASAVLLFRLVAVRAARVIRREFGAPRYIVVAGTGERALRLGRLLERSGQYGIRLLGFLADGNDPPREIKLSALYPAWPFEHLADLLRKQVIDEVLFAVPSERLADLEEVFLLCDEEGVRTRVAADFFPHVNSTVYLERLGSTPLLTFSAAPDDEIRLMIKRILDVILAVLGLLVLAPFMLLVAVLVRLTSPGPAIFRQVRCGLNGRRFLFYKFRSMCRNAEDLKPQLLHLSERETAFKIANDPRLTPIGRFLRKFSIDEWPQLWNVVKGDMSLVGPRPAVPDEVDQYQRWQRRRLRMRPGMTCLWALAGRDAVDFETWMRLDMQYIDTWSLALDWKILLLTIPRVLSGKGAN